MRSLYYGKMSWCRTDAGTEKAVWNVRVPLSASFAGLHSEGVRSKSQCGHRLTSLADISRNFPESPPPPPLVNALADPTSDHNRFLPYSFQFIIRYLPNSQGYAFCCKPNAIK